MLRTRLTAIPQASDLQIPGGSRHELMRLRFLQPRYWPTWAGLAALRITELLPYTAQRGLGHLLGELIQRLPLPYVRIARRNIELCLPSLSSADQEALLKQHCRSLGMGLCETANTWWSDNARICKLATIEGASHLHAALALGRGAILVGGHFTTIEMATRVLGTVVNLNMLYRPTKNALLSKAMHDSFARHGNPIPYDDVRSMIKALRRNEAVWYAPDQSYRNKGAAMVDFFGIAAATNTSTSRLARVSGAPVLTYFAERLPGNAGYRAVIGAPLQDFPGPNPRADAERFNALLEKHILSVPEQYLWPHRRFKGLSADYPNYYGRDSRNAPVRPSRSPQN